jgi:hypothetical protein
MIRKLLFKLHIVNSYPSYLTGLDGSKVPCNVIRTDGKSYVIEDRELPPVKTVHFDVYTPPGER